jgi:hypothetical protein
MENQGRKHVIAAIDSSVNTKLKGSNVNNYLMAKKAVKTINFSYSRGEFKN